MRAIRQPMHIDRANEITMSREPAGTACPLSSLGLVLMPTARTLARCSSFGASEAQDVSRFGFVGEIVDILAIFPASHPLVVMASLVLAPDPMWMANEERPGFIFAAKVDHLATRLMPQITDAPLDAAALLVLGALQLLPPTRRLLTASLLFGKLSQVLVALSLERADTTSCDNHRFACIGGDGGK